MNKYVVSSTEKDLSDAESSTKGYNFYFQHDENLEPSDQLKPKNKKKENKKPKKQVVGVLELFRYADHVDVLLLVVGLIAAVANGTGMPLMVIVCCDMTAFAKQSASKYTSVNSCSCPTIPGIDIEIEMTKYAYYCVGIGFAVLVLSTIQAWTFLVAAKRQTARIQFFFTVLHQEMAWFDSTQIGTLNTRLTDFFFFSHEGIGDKICIFVQFFATFLARIITGFIYGWKLTLVILSISLLLAASAAVWSSLLAPLTAKKLSAYAKAGAVAKEILTAVRTVVAFNGQQKALAKYDANLEVARSVGLKKSITTNTSLSVSQFLIFGPYALAFWYGTKLTAEDENYDISRVLIVFPVFIGALTLGAAANLEKAANERGAAYEVYQIINKKQLIDSSSKEGYKPDRLIGETEFRNVHFGYPSRPDVKVSVHFKLIYSGKAIAFVGASSCGKSTTIQLLHRFYDTVEGEITLDGWDIWTLNVKWLQENIGVVSQEPVLFATVAKNILYGREDISDAEIEQAAKEANAFVFISRLPDKFNTMVGERGAQLSGGQEQIAIAHALARNPNILLDGATSTLDTQSEPIVQAALDKVAGNRFMFGKSAEILTMRLHSLSFKALLQQIGWYDDQKNAVGVLLTWLATDTSQVKGATGSLGLRTMTVLILLTAIIIAFIYSWQFTLLVQACLPFLVATNAVSLSSMSGHAAKDQRALGEAGRISTETAENIRTVALLTKEEVFCERYVASLNGPYTWDVFFFNSSLDALKKAPLYGFTYKVAQSAIVAVFRFGAWLIAHCPSNFEDVFVVYSSIMFAAINIGQSTFLDYGRAKLSTQRIFKHLDRKPLMSSYSEEGEKLSNFEGNIEFRNVHFAWPDVQVLQGFSVKVNKGQTLALLRSSSCGKSTSIQLLERFYNPVEGQVLADGFDTRSLHIQWLRSRLGLVSQEHIFFDCSIAENIQYGDNSRVVSQDKVEEVAKAANIHSFIERKMKYNTSVGEKGTQLSEGQKQRIAIAHTLVHNPAILLPHEANSALDTSEKRQNTEEGNSEDVRDLERLVSEDSSILKLTVSQDSLSSVEWLTQQATSFTKTGR
ncbi:LOW QUALITY PROTEIN: ATP-binding cassette sub-family B member 5 [Amazona ochrocephala]